MVRGNRFPPARLAPLLLVPVLGAALSGVLVPGCTAKPEGPSPSFVGAEVCALCHRNQYDLWKGSDHALAMRPANGNTILGNFDNATFTYYGVPTTFFRKGESRLVRTDGPDGNPREFEIAYTFGVHPLQQYLIPFPRGRYQALTIAWDSRPRGEGGRRWFHLYPREPVRHDDLLHWTKPSGTWNFMCADCHSTGLRKNYDPATDSYRTAWSEIHVACEACHGPGSRHVEWARKNPGATPGDGGDAALAVRPKDRGRAMEACFPCHSRRVVLDNGYVPGTPFLDAYLPSLLTPELYHPDGQILEEVYEYGSFLQSRMYRAGVTCRDCHDPHALGLRAPGNGACASCHDPGVFDSPAHHRHRQGSEGARCVACHMPARNYMVVDPRRDHSLRIPRPDLAAALGVPDPCTGCHRDRTSRWAAAAVRGWLGPGRTLPRHYGEAIEAGRRGAPGSVEALSALALDNTQPGIARATALQLLRDRISPSLLPVFRQALGDPDPLVRGAAVDSMEGFEPETRWMFAGHLLSDPVRAVRYQAAPILAGVPRTALSGDQGKLLDRAVKEYERGNLANADLAPYHINLGVIRLRTGRPEQAEAAYRDAIRLDPTFPAAYVNLADLYRERRLEGEGETILRQGLSASPMAAELHHALGLLLVRQKRLPEALPHLSEAAARRPDLPRYALAEALAQEAAGQRSKALATLTRAYRRHPYDPDLLYTLATFSRDRGKAADARRFARELAAVSPGDPGAVRLLQEMESRVR